jgi:hypothetical protein
MATVLTVQWRTIVIKLSAGQNIHVSALAKVFPAVSGRIFALAVTYPMAIQKNKVIMGESVARKVVIIAS